MLLKLSNKVMKQITLLITCLFSSVLLIAQQSDTTQVADEDEKTGFWHEITSLYAGAGTEASPTPDGIEPHVQLQLGAEYKKFHLGLTYLDYIGEYRQLLIFPNEFSMLYRHGGFYVGRDLFSTGFIHVNAILQWSHGDVVWQRAATSEDIFRDKLTVWQPSLQLELNAGFPLSGYVNVGYRQVSGLELPRITSEDLSGLVVQFGVRVGLFRMRKKENPEDEESN